MLTQRDSRRTSGSSARRASDNSCFSGHTSSSENCTHGLDLDSLRKKLQRTTIEDIGVQGVALWWAAFKLQKNARSFLRPVEPSISIALSGTSTVLESMDVDTKSSHPFLHFDQQPIPTDVLARSLRHHPSRGYDALPKVYKRNWTWLPPDTQSLLLTPYRDTKNTWGLPDEICRRILVTASGARNILTYRQQLSVMDHARSRITLIRGMDTCSKGATYQKLKMLEAMGCLTYPMRLSGDYEYS
jgi:hypothetical protein